MLLTMESFLLVYIFFDRGNRLANEFLYAISQLKLLSPSNIEEDVQMLRSHSDSVLSVGMVPRIQVALYFPEL